MAKIDWFSVLVVIAICAIIIAMALAFTGKEPEKEKPKIIIQKDNSQEDGVSINMISGTEYIVGDAGQIIMELRNKNFEAITDANCSATIQYHNKTIFLGGDMLGNPETGTYYFNFTVPDAVGVFEYSVDCERGTRHYITGKSFHVGINRVKAWTTP